MEKKNVVVVGGGTGTFTVLSGLKRYPHLNLSVIVTMTDSGGSNRVIRDEFGLLPTSDLRQCMVALASEKTSSTLRDLFTYRYSQGTGISGMTFGNLFMAALTDIYKSQQVSIEKTCELLGVKGKIIPVTYDDVQLVATYSDNTRLVGEHQIDEPPAKFDKGLRITNLDTIPFAKANPTALKAIKNADIIILGPGDLYTSILSNFVVKGISSAITNSKAKVISVMNLFTKFNETNNFSAGDFINEFEKYTKKGRVNMCIIHKNGNFPARILDYYKKEKSYPVEDDLQNIKGLKVIRGNFVSGEVYKKPKSDRVKRSLIRHDPEKLAKAIASII